MNEHLLSATSSCFVLEGDFVRGNMPTQPTKMSRVASSPT